MIDIKAVRTLRVKAESQKTFIGGILRELPIRFRNPHEKEG